MQSKLKNKTILMITETKGIRIKSGIGFDFSIFSMFQKNAYSIHLMENYEYKKRITCVSANLNVSNF